MQGYVTLLGVLINKYGYRFGGSATSGDSCQPDKDTLIMLALSEILLKLKEEDGWKYGGCKNPEKKEHPCFIPYEQLPKEQKAKDYIFKAICDFFKYDCLNETPR